MRELKEFDFQKVWSDKAREGRIPYSWLQFVSDLDRTIDEVEELARKDKSIAKLVILYKQKCQASIIQEMFKDLRNLVKYWELEYSKVQDSHGDEEWRNLSTIR